MNCRSSITLANPQFLKAIISLGANLDSIAGTAEQTVSAAIKELKELSKGSFSASSLYVTSPVDCSPGTPDFVNAVALLEMDADDAPHSLLAKMQALETAFGRTPSDLKNAPRALDLDLVAFGDLQVIEPDLCLPHPKATQRKFVLEPLAELAPDLRLPGQTETVEQLLQLLGSEQTAKRIH